jgi:hypothetical protein
MRPYRPCREHFQTRPTTGADANLDHVRFEEVLTQANSLFYSYPIAAGKILDREN